jgi:hypothetical protein
MLGLEEKYVQCFIGNLEGRDYVEDTGITGRIILKWF